MKQLELITTWEGGDIQYNNKKSIDSIYFIDKNLEKDTAEKIDNMEKIIKSLRNKFNKKVIRPIW